MFSFSNQSKLSSEVHSSTSLVTIWIKLYKKTLEDLYDRTLRNIHHRSICSSEMILDLKKKETDMFGLKALNFRLHRRQNCCGGNGTSNIADYQAHESISVTIPLSADLQWSRLWMKLMIVMDWSDDSNIGSNLCRRRGRCALWLDKEIVSTAHNTRTAFEKVCSIVMGR